MFSWNNNVKLLISKDSSSTLENKTTGEHYHSIFGAVQESKHVFIKMGLETVLAQKNEINLLEVGFGTGLNFLLTADFIQNKNCKISYTSVEPNPIHPEILQKLNHDKFLKNEPLWLKFKEFYKNLKEKQNLKFENIELKIIPKKFLEIPAYQYFDLIYYDAFSPSTAPEMWDEKHLDAISNHLAKPGFMVTYCVRGFIKRHFQALGFNVEKPPGPPGKREMLRVIRI